MVARGKPMWSFGLRESIRLLTSVQFRSEIMRSLRGINERERGVGI